MKATDLLQPNETAIVILTRGPHLDASKPDASTGWWKLHADAQADRVIICHRPAGQQEADVYIGPYAGKELRESDGRYRVLLSDCRLMGTTSLPWHEFMDAKPGRRGPCALLCGANE